MRNCHILQGSKFKDQIELTFMAYIYYSHTTLPVLKSIINVYTRYEFYDECQHL